MFFVREEFSFNKLYYLYFGIFLNKCYVSRLVLYSCLMLQEMYNKL